jgi:RNA polymerase sigma-70 factor, ECF subfamily
MGQDAGDRHAPAGPTPERFEVFYLREYPKVVGLLHGLLGSRLVAEELAQETFLVAYRDWDRISRLDNPRAWVRKVDAASRLREIVWHAGRPVTNGRAPLLPDEPRETPELLEASLVPPPPPRPGPQRLALVVNLLLVLGLGVVLGVAAGYMLDADSTAPASAASTIVAQSTTRSPARPAAARLPVAPATSGRGARPRRRVAGWGAGSA